MRRSPAVLSLLLAVSAALPAAALVSGPAAAAEPAQTVGLEYTYVPPGVEIVPSGEVGTNDVRWGSCGWASMWVTDSGPGEALFEADAGSSHGVIVRADWTIDWRNNDTGRTGAWSGTTWQFSTTWGVDREAWTGAGLVYGTLRKLVVTHWDGVVCTGLVPWDWEQVT